MNNITNPYKYTIKGKTTIVDTEDGKYVLKEKKSNKNIKGLYNYLKSRNFSNFPDLIGESRDEMSAYEYIEDCVMPLEQRSTDMVDIVANLHHKTLYTKEVSEDKFKEVYESINSNIRFYTDYFDNLYNTFFKDKYMSPSKYIFMRNFSKISAALTFCDKELDSWYELVKEEKKERVSIVHNNLSVDHFLKSDRDVLISWDNHSVDTPVLDLIKFYQNDYLKISFSSVLEEYLNKFPLLEHEKKLFFVIINIPQKITFDDSEFENCKNIRRKLDYIFKTEELTKPFYEFDEK